MAFITITRALWASVLAGMAASLCCYGPVFFLVLELGGGAWALGLTTVRPYRPLFIGLTLLFLGLALSRLYLVPAYAVNWSRAKRCRLKRQWHWFWLVTVLLLGLLAAPWLAPQLR
ncbi:mercuric transporter MerT family protein [Pseudomonas sp. D(2018)]|uniref:mercuric transporter MerT family protein n=1 Tax=Pseudomonas sp. D(2018) TaxID=2502238 RepID=UPI0010F5126D|nr:mercuric transporter MerT family protein [Pseudomonas sp. D(2018)]